jgi:pterin-4a-carbinolamine dehydratase
MFLEKWVVFVLLNMLSVKISITTHAAGGLTLADITLARLTETAADRYRLRADRVS